jgi:ubiquinone biosynthesis protein UbiJ
MPGQVRQLVEMAVNRPLPPQLKGWSNSYLFDLEDDEDVAFTIRDGMIQIDSNRTAADVDCVIRATDGQMYRLLAGEDNWQTAWMRGEIDVQGNIQAANWLYAFTRSRRQAGQERAAA